MKPHKKIIYIWFGGFAIVKTVIFFFGLIAWIFGIGNVFADNDCTTLTSNNRDSCCITEWTNTYLNCSDKWIYTINENVFNSDVINIDLSDNHISDISNLNNLVNLKVLDLSNNKISNIPQQINLPSLTTLKLNNNLLSENLSSLSNIIWGNTHTLYLNNLL